MRNAHAGKFHNDAKHVRNKILPRWPDSIIIYVLISVITLYVKCHFLQHITLKEKNTRIRTKICDQ